MHKGLVIHLQADKDKVHVVDGFPLRVCHPKRVGRAKCFRDEAAFGFCATKEEYYYGFKGVVLIDSAGIITDFSLTAANIDERETAHDFIGKIKGFLLGDKGFIMREEMEEEFQKAGIQVETPLKKNMLDTRDKSFVWKIKKKRRLVETVIGQLAERFHMERTKARDLWHLTNRLTRKILSHTLCAYLNLKEGNMPLQFEKLVVA